MNSQNSASQSTDHRGNADRLHAKKIVVEVTLLPVLTKPFHMGTPDINDDVTLGIRQGVQLYRCLCLTSVTANKGSRGQVGSVQIIGHGVRPPAG